jgi:hypothetical protein
LSLLSVLLLIFHGSGNPPYSKLSTQWTFRVQFAIVAVMTLWLVYQRMYRTDYSMDKKLRAKFVFTLSRRFFSLFVPQLISSLALFFSSSPNRKKQGAVTGYDTKSLKLAISHFGPRMIGTAGCWFANDFFFYGNKLFQSTFIKVIIPAGSTVMDVSRTPLQRCSSVREQSG